MIDLHTHSTASDGTLTPEELVDLAAEKGLRAIALTDHDTVGGISAALERGNQRRVFGISRGGGGGRWEGDGGKHNLWYHTHHHHPFFFDRFSLLPARRRGSAEKNVN